jgi:biopolymer transport protein ExbD
MRRHRHRRRSQAEVELNLASMLDMAFQLLAFFILTFRPSPIEGQLAMRLPDPVPVTRLATPADEDAGPGVGGLAADKSLSIRIQAALDGGIAKVSLGYGHEVFAGAPDAHKLHALDLQLRDVFLAPFEQVVVEVDSGLRYEELMRVMDVCLRQRLWDGRPLQNLSLVEISHDKSQD